MGFFNLFPSVKTLDHISNPQHQQNEAPLTPTIVSHLMSSDKSIGIPESEKEDEHIDDRCITTKGM